MNLAFPIDCSYTRSASSGTSMPAEPPTSVVREKPCPMVKVIRMSCHRHGRKAAVGGNLRFAHKTQGHTYWAKFGECDNVER